MQSACGVWGVLTYPSVVMQANTTKANIYIVMEENVAIKDNRRIFFKAKRLEEICKVQKVS